MRDGPVEDAIASLVISRAGSNRSDDSTDEPLPVEPTIRRTLGDFRVDLRPLLSNRALGKSACSNIANQLCEVPEIDAAVGIPPRVYLKTSIGFLYEQVIPPVLDHPNSFGTAEKAKGMLVIVSFSDPNTNKPLHLGHLRNNFIGMTLSKLLEAHGYRVQREAVHSDWGIHICRMLVAYQRWGGGATPLSSGEKSDHFVGKYYVMFHEEDEKQRASSNGEAGLSSMEREARALLSNLEAGDAKLRRLNQVLTDWADRGIRETYSRIGSHFDVIFRESDSLSSGKELIADSLAAGFCQRRPDGSVYIDLTDRGLGEITLLRKDGTPVVYTQLLGFRVHRNQNYPSDGVLSLFGRQWESGAAVLNEILHRMRCDWASQIEPVIFGMVRLPEGLMRSRDGISVSADSFLDRIRDRLLDRWEQSSGRQLSSSESDTCDRLAVGVSKYYLLRTPRSKEIVFNWRRVWNYAVPGLAAIFKLIGSLEFRAQSGELEEPPIPSHLPLHEGRELRNLLLHLNSFPRVVDAALSQREPAHLLRYVEELRVAAAACDRRRIMTARLALATAAVSRRCLSLLNIELPDSFEDLPPLFPRSNPQTSSLKSLT